MTTRHPLRYGLVALLSDSLEKRPCTCHPDDRPPGPCPQLFAASQCQAAARAAQPPEPPASRR